MFSPCLACTDAYMGWQKWRWKTSTHRECDDTHMYIHWFDPSDSSISYILTCASRICTEDSQVVLLFSSLTQPTPLSIRCLPCLSCYITVLGWTIDGTIGPGLYTGFNNIDMYTYIYTCTSYISWHVLHITQGHVYKWTMHHERVINSVLVTSLHRTSHPQT